MVVKLSLMLNANPLHPLKFKSIELRDLKFVSNLFDFMHLFDFT